MQEIKDRQAQAKQEKAAAIAEGSVAAAARANSFATLNAALKEKFAAKTTVVNSLKALRARQNELREIVNKTKERLHFKNDRAPEFVQKNLEDITQRAQALDKRIQTMSLSAAQEKQAVAELNQLQRLKLEVRDLEKVVAELRALEPQIANEEARFKALDEEIKALKEQEARLREERASAQEAREAQRERAQIRVNGRTFEELREEKRALQKRRDELFAQLRANQQEVRAAKDKYFEEERARRKEEFEKRQQAREQLRKERDAKRLELQKELERAMPFEEELAMCNKVIQALEPYVPRPDDKPKDGPAASSVPSAAAAISSSSSSSSSPSHSPSPSPAAKEKGKRAATPPAKFKLEWSLIATFEKLSLAMPTKLEQVAPILEEVRKKREFYLSRQAEHEKKLLEEARQERLAREAEKAKELKKKQEEAAKRAQQQQQQQEQQEQQEQQKQKQQAADGADSPAAPAPVKKPEPKPLDADLQEEADALFGMALDDDE
jgi:uncharacterized coiled-coil DUF342 family protein